MRDNFDRCLSLVLRHEGGFADHPADPGGATMRGVTIGTYAQFKGRKVTKAELRNISDADLRAIYRRNYWDKVRGDELPLGLDYVAFDAAVNSGPARGARWLQHAVDVMADGKVGPVTVEAAKRCNPFAAINEACDVRLRFLRSLKTWATFGKGWSRRVEGVRTVALEMAALTAKPVADRNAADPAAKTGQAPHDPADNAKMAGRFIFAALALAAASVGAWWADLAEAVRDFVFFWQ